jgi:RNA polymerase sigma-70 factor (ECF subfamily)
LRRRVDGLGRQGGVVVESALFTGTGEAPAHQDVELVGKAQTGDREAFEALYRRHVRKVYNLVHRVVGAQDAEEVTQEVFYQVYRNLESFENRSSFYTWIYRVATNVSLQHAKRQARHRREGPLEKVPDATLAAAVRHTGPEKEAEQRATYRDLERAIDRLPPNQRNVLVLGPIQGHSYEQIASILGTNEEVVKGRLHRARENLRHLMGRET